MCILELYLKFSEQSEARSVAFCMDLLMVLAAGRVSRSFWRVDADPLISSPLPNQLRIPAFEPIH